MAAFTYVERSQSHAHGWHGTRTRMTRYTHTDDTVHAHGWHGTRTRMTRHTDDTVHVCGHGARKVYITKFSSQNES